MLSGWSLKDRLRILLYFKSFVIETVFFRDFRPTWVLASE